MAEANQIVCPHCGQSYAVRAEQWGQYLGRTINCTRCGKPFVVSVPGGQGLPMGGDVAPQPPQTVDPSAAVPFPAGAPMPGQAVPYGAYGYGPPPGPRPVTGWAIASLIIGILSFCIPVIGSLIAIGTGIAGIVVGGGPRKRGRGMAIAGLVLGCVSMLIVPLQIAILLPALNRAREQANRVKCASNMRQLGMAMTMYANQHGGNLPNTLGALIKADPSLLPGVFVCPADDKTPPAGSTPGAMAAEVDSGQHTSFIYTGAGLSVTSPIDTVLLFEPLADHRNEGTNVLFGDGSVSFVSPAEAQDILRQQSIGAHPIMLPGRH